MIGQTCRGFNLISYKVYWQVYQTKHSNHIYKENEKEKRYRDRNDEIQRKQIKETVIFSLQGHYHLQRIFTTQNRKSI